VYPKSESPYKQVPSSSAASSAQGSAGPTAISAQVRRCSPKLLPGERLGSVQLVCRMYTRIPEDDAPAEVERPRPRLRSQVPSAAAAAGRTVDAGSKNMRAVTSKPIARIPAAQSVASPDPGSSAQHAARNVAAPPPAAAAAAVPKKCQLIYTAAKPAAPPPPAKTPVATPAPASAHPTRGASPAVPKSKPTVTYTDARPASAQASPAPPRAASVSNTSSAPTVSRTSARLVASPPPVAPGLSPAAAPPGKPSVSYAESLPTSAPLVRDAPPHPAAAMPSAQHAPSGESPSRAVPKTDRQPTPPFSEGEAEDEDDEGSHSADSRSPIDRRAFQEAVWPSPNYGEASLSSSTHAHSPAFSASMGQSCSRSSP
jgi:hypothetical protein